MTTLTKRIVAAVLACVGAAMSIWAGKLYFTPANWDIDDAIRFGDVARVKHLLSIQPELVSKRDKRGRTPLYRAADEGNKDVVQMLLSHKADINAKNDMGETPLNWMISVGNKKGAEVLLSFNADVNAGNSRGYTPLHYTAIMNRKEIAELLLAHHADINARTGGGKGGTPLDVAVMVKRNEMAELFRSHGGKSGKELDAEVLPKSGTQ